MQEADMTDRNRGILYMVLSSLFFALMAALVKLSGDLPTMEKVFFRNLVGLAASSYIIYKSGGSFLGNNRVYLFYRSFFGLLGVFFYFYAIDRLLLANAVVLNQMSPFFVLILSALFLREKIVRLQTAAIVIALAGVVFVSKPELNYTVLPAVAALLSAFFAASAYTIVRHLRLSDSPETIVFYFTGLTTLVSLPFLLLGQFVMPTLPQLAALLGVGVFATAAQFFMTHAYRYAEAGDLSIYSYGITVFSIITGILIFFEFPDILSLIGVVLILTGAWLNYRAKAGPKSSAVT
jgi:drug/metabolite transporter (DMT)-like permease